MRKHVCGTCWSWRANGMCYSVDPPRMRRWGDICPKEGFWAPARPSRTGTTVAPATDIGRGDSTSRKEHEMLYMVAVVERPTAMEASDGKQPKVVVEPHPATAGNAGVLAVQELAALEVPKGVDTARLEVVCVPFQAAK